MARAASTRTYTAPPERGTAPVPGALAQGERGVVLVAALQLGLERVEHADHVGSGRRDVGSSVVSSSTAAARRSSSSTVGSEMPASATSRSMRRRASSSSSSGTPTRTASPREAVCGSSPARIVVSRSTSGVVAVGRRGPELRLQDLGAALHEPAQQRQILALGEALVASLAEVLQAQVGETVDVGGVADAVDAAVGGVVLRVAHAPILRRAATRRLRTGLRGFSRRRAARSRG